MTRYAPERFEVESIEDAKAIILTPEGGDTEERWEKETPFLMELIGEHFKLSPRSIVLDFGCGIGRLAKEIIQKYRCLVIGVDISPTMRALANVYVDSPSFVTCDPDALERMGIQCDAAISIWTLQHVWDLRLEIDRINKALKKDGDLFLLNNNGRAVPITGGAWHNDGQDIKAVMKEFFVPGEEGQLSEEVAPKGLVEHTFWQFYKV